MSRASRTAGGRDQDGFVLVATLWVLAAITVGAAYFAEQVSRSRGLAQQAQGAAQALADMESTRADILFRLATSGISVHGLGEGRSEAIHLDDSPYRGSGRDVVRLQDCRGLLNVNFPEEGLLPRLLGQFGVPVERQDALMDKLRDYVDTDGFRRLNGAEAREYEAAGFPPPANDWLTTPYELRGILGWRDEASLWADGRFLQLVTTCREPGFNPNTAPRELLTVLTGGPTEIAQRVVEQRNADPLTSTAQLASLTETGAFGGANLIYFPGNSIRITQQGEAQPWALQYVVTLTQDSSSAPWRVDYHVRIASPPATLNDPATLNEREVPSLPPWSASRAQAF